jgi:hypothetical protein
MQANLKKQAKSKEPVEIPTKQELLLQNKIELDKLDGILNDSDFIE